MKETIKPLRVAAILGLGLLSQSSAFARQPQEWTQDFSVSHSSSDRLDAVKSVFQGPNSRAHLALEQAFSQEPRASIRAWMVRAEDHSKPGNIPFLESALQDASVQVREAAIVALGESKNASAAKDLAALLPTEPDSGARITIAFWLGFLGGSQATAALSQSLAQDKDANVRLQAAQSLSKINTFASRSALKQAAKDTDSRVRGMAP